MRRMIKTLLLLALSVLLLWTAGAVLLSVIKKQIPPADGTTQAVIVLGAQVRDNGELSLQLEWRLEAALAYWQQYPQRIVVCGAQGKGEPVTEAEAMKTYLVGHGVPPEQILMEDRSFNTRQNLRNAIALLGGDCRSVAIVTSDYHLPRALAMARDAGLEPQGIGSRILPEYWIKNHFREVLAWGKYWLQKAGLPLD